MRLIDTLARRCVQAYVVVVQRFHDEAALSCTPSLTGSKVNRSQRMRTILKLQGELHIVSDRRDHTYSCFNMHIKLRLIEYGLGTWQEGHKIEEWSSFVMWPSPRRPHYALSPPVRQSVCLSVCLSVCPVPAVNSKTESCTTFKLREVIHVGNNWQSSFEVKRSKVMVTGSGKGDGCVLCRPFVEDSSFLCLSARLAH